jgi:WD40 repeat protein
MRRTAVFHLAALLTLADGSRIGARPDSQDVSPQMLKQLIEQLGDDDFDKRQQASQRLGKIGQPALAALKQAAQGHTDPEVKSRAADLVRLIEKELRGELLVINGQPGYWLNRIVFTPDGKQAVATGGAVILYDLTTAREVHRCLEVGLARPGLVLTRDGKHFFTGHQHDHVLRMGEVQTGKEVRTFEGHKGGINAIALSPDESLMVSGGLDKTLRQWEVKTGKQVREFGGITEVVRSVDYSPDGRHVASGHESEGRDCRVRLWDAETGREILSLKGHGKEVTGVLFVPDGHHILSASMDGAIILWDKELGKEVRRMAHAGGVRGLALSPDGKRALSAGFSDGAVRLWDLSRGKELHHFEGHVNSVLGVAFSADGKRALSSDSNCTIRLWRLPE